MEQKILIFKLIITFLLIFFSFASFAENIIKGKAKIIDGDTIHIGKYKIRLHGIDAPEIKQTCTINKIIWGCGFESSQALENIISPLSIPSSLIIISRLGPFGSYGSVCIINRALSWPTMSKNSLIEWVSPVAMT